MTADEMFEELGYIKFNWLGSVSYRKEETDVYRRIGFDKENKEITARLKCRHCNAKRPIRIKPQEVQAIHKKCKEMGWLN